MKKIGIIGGLSWESTAEYYRLINQEIKRREKGLHSAKIIIESLDQFETFQLQKSGDWKGAAKLLRNAAVNLEVAGAECILIATNTMHKIIDEVKEGIGIPFINIIDVTGQALREQKIETVALLGTRFTMEQEFYKRHLSDKFGLKVIVPSPADIEIVHEIIYSELCNGKFLPQSRVLLMDVAEKLAKEGAQGLILGCTELGLTMMSEKSSIPMIDTTRLHALAAVDWAT